MGLKAEIDAEVNPEASAELDDLISKTDTDYKIKVALDTDGQTPAQLLEIAQNDEATFKAKFELDVFWLSRSSFLFTKSRC